jgi:DUF971 family protein
MKRIPSNIKLQKKSRILEVSFGNEVFSLPCEYLRVHSPSAEVKGHGPGQEVLQTGKELVNIVAIEPVGQYAIKLIFSDSHNSGIYSWDLLYELGEQRQSKWQSYLARLDEAGIVRDPQDSDSYLS